MKKRILVLIMLLCCTFMFFGCGGDKKTDAKGSSSEIKAPSNSDWQAAGLNNGFKATVTGDLAIEQIVNSEIEMKWTSSNETSLDNTISWLQAQGYTTSEEKETIGSMIAYTSTKTVNNVEMIAEVTYIKEDATMGGESFKAGELYVAIYPAETPSNGGSSNGGSNGGTSTSWPTSQINQAIGTSIPSYNGDCDYQAANNVATITVSGVSESAFDEYEDLLTADGFILSGTQFRKSVTGGTIILTFSLETALNTPNKLIIVVYKDTNAGVYSTWPGSNIGTKFQGEGILRYDGGTSFDFVDITDAYSFGDDLLANKVKGAQMITVYGTNQAELDDYIAKITDKANNGKYTDYDGEYVYQHEYMTFARKTTISFSGISNGKLYINIVLTPMAELSELEAAYTLPTNVKVVYTESNSLKYECIKIGNDYYCKKMNMFQSDRVMEEKYYKYDNDTWTYYLKDYLEETVEWVEKDTISKRSEVESAVFGFMVEGVEDMTKGASTTIIGVTVDTYTGTNPYLEETKLYNPENHLVYSYTFSMGSAVTTEVTSFDASVTSFGTIVLPE